MSYALPADVDERPVVIDGAGTLGRRIAAMYAAGGSDVRIFDLSKEQREAARRYAIDHAEEFKQRLNLDAPRLGAVEASDELGAALRGAWMVIEAVPEKLELKRQVFGELDRLADPDAILASNSSSLPSSQFIDNVQHPERVLNTHYQQPPELPSVELMSDGRTDEDDYRCADAQAAAVRVRALPRSARERRLHLQPHLGRDQARVPHGCRGGRRAARGR
jgi:3-hydroxybutyryl-CoA dehydrogenase